MVYIGKKIPEVQRDIYMSRAWLYIKNITLGKIVAYEEEQDTRICVSAIADVMYDFEARKFVHSESNDGYSVTYKDAEENSVLYKTALQYLPHDCIYRGVDVVGGLLC